MDRNACWPWVLVLAAGAGGCVLDTGSFSLRDGSSTIVDIGRLDAGTMEDGASPAKDAAGRMDSPDAATPDAPTPDAPTPDAPTPDTPTPDTADPADAADGGVNPMDAGSSCNGMSVDLARDPANCGSCGTVCATPDNAAATCVAGACGVTCNAGFGDCNATSGDGCETDTRTTLTSCGRCDNSCPAPANATATCVAGACGLACDEGFGDCDGTASNGCEADLRADPAHCGTCPRACAVGQSCSAGACVCSAGQTLCAGSCVNTQSDAANCGGCGTRCAASQVCSNGSCGASCTDPTPMRCGTACVNPATDPANCGECGRACSSAAHAPASCASGACRLACDAGFENCDGNAANGCEASLDSPATCGGCASACPARSNATATCAAGACGFTCNTGSGDCDNNASNGCEVNLTSARANCGACGTVCPARSNATATCASSACGLACNAGFADCNATSGDGCETDTRSSLTNCGRCGAICPARANATATCAAGACGFTCAVNFADCDGLASNGCEVDLRTDRTHCGTCPTACATGQSCVVGACACPSGQTLCGGACVNLQTDPAHCGACPTVCAAGQVCRNGACGVDCGSLTACGTACVNLQTDPARCGTCTTVCAPHANSSPTCAGAACGFSCTGGFADCNTSDGCETDTRSSVASCGRCGNVCPAPANATAACVASACGFSCNSGYADCNTAAGCETDIRSSLSNCGRCGATCPAAPANATATCSSSTCGFRCISGYGDCTTSAGCETNLDSDRSNCGSCGRVCPTNRPVCRDGVCGCTGAICLRCASHECRDDTLCTCL